MTLRDKIKQKALTTAEIYAIKVLNKTQREVMFWGKEFFFRTPTFRLALLFYSLCGVVRCTLKFLRTSKFLSLNAR